MNSKETLPFDEGGELVSVDTIAVEIIEGPDAGRSAIADDEILTLGTAPNNHMVLTDPTVSRYHLELRRGPHGIRVIDPGSTNGVHSQGLRVHDAVLSPGMTTLRMGQTVIRVSDGETQIHPLPGATRLGDLQGRSEPMRRLMQRIERAARADTSVLVVGESGTGKELIARALHDLGPRSTKPFITVDCGAIAANLVASELFGHERGAFTGAERTHVGAFERARGGTLFLDELGELPSELQPNLLGALERRRFRRVGGSEEIDSDVRVVAATHRDLRADVNEGRFRLDLYYRVAVVTLNVVPLRARTEDLPLLVSHFLEEMGHGDEPMQPGGLFDTDAIERLARHHWPGNVRELRNLVEATVAMGERPDEFVPSTSSSSAPPPPVFESVLSLPYKDARAALLHSFERQYFERKLQESGGNVAAAARAARMDRSHLFHLLRRHDLR